MSPLRRILPTNFREHLDRRDIIASGDDTASVTLRAILCGCALSALIAIGVPYGSMLIQGTRMGLSSATPAAFFLFFVLLVTLHLGLGALKRAWAFGNGELLTIFVMMTVATAIPTRGVVGMLLPMITGTFYYASPENRWTELIHPHLNAWVVVADQEAVNAFYEGQGPGADIPWNAWALPLASWLLFYAAFYLTLISLMGILRRQWVDNERLAYPLAQVPLAMIEGKTSQLLKPFFRNYIMWIGLAIPFVIGSLEALHHYFPAMPSPTMQTRIGLFRDSITLRIGVNFLMLGFAYLIGTQLSFSLWLFYLLHTLEDGLLHSLHLHHTEDLGEWSSAGIGHQMMGAFLVFVGYGLWTARAHLLEVWRKTLRPGEESREMASYRFYVSGLFVGATTMILWLWQSGLPLWIAAFVVFSALCILVALARIVAEVGTPTITPSMVPGGCTGSAVGVPALGAKGMVALGYTFVWIGDLLVFMTAPLANGMRLGSELRGNRRRLLWGMAAAMLISLVVSTWYTLHLAYTHGAVNLHAQYFSGFADNPSTFTIQKLLHPTGPDGTGWLWTGGGALLMGALILARNHWAWWPLHPIGFAASMGWVMDQIWFSILLAWLIKTLALRFGGASLYSKTVPFFLGLALGQIVVGGCWLLIDALTGTVGNRLRVY